MLAALGSTSVPPRYLDADRMLRDAIATNIEALELRNRAIAQNDNASWRQHTAILGEATALFQAAYLAFPADNRPVPAPKMSPPLG